MVGKTLLLDNELYTVSAVIDTGFDFSRYELMNTPDDKLSTAENVLRFILSSEFDYEVNCSLTGAAMVGKGAVKEMASEEPVLYDSDRGHFSYMAYSSGNDSGLDIWSSYYAKLSVGALAREAETLLWLGLSTSAFITAATRNTPATMLLSIAHAFL